MCLWKLSVFWWGLNSFVYRYLLYEQLPGLEMTQLKGNFSGQIFLWMYWAGKRQSDVFRKTRNCWFFFNMLNSAWNILQWKPSYALIQQQLMCVHRKTSSFFAPCSISVLWNILYLSRPSYPCRKGWEVFQKLLLSGWQCHLLLLCIHSAQPEVSVPSTECRCSRRSWLTEELITGNL